MRRKKFLSYAAAASTLSLLPKAGFTTRINRYTGFSKRMKLSYTPYDLQLRHVFTLANSSRSTTPVMLTRIDYDGFTGYGEASMPPYLGESHESATAFLKQVNLSQFSSPFLLEDILSYIDQIAAGNCAAKAAIDIALHDLTGKLMNQPWYRIWGLNPDHSPMTSFTIGMDTPEVVRQKVREAAPYRILKVKMGRGDDRLMVETIREITRVPLCVDVNQGWSDRHQALDMIHWLKEKGIVFIEQPLPIDRLDDLAWLRAESPLPIFGDEAVQRLTDMEALSGVYDGINIKLMKCTGMREAHKMAILARARGMKVMLGCMTETSCAVSAAAQLAPLAEFADLDGNLLISNDPYEGVRIVDGRVTVDDLPGIGLTVINQLI